MAGWVGVKGDFSLYIVLYLEIVWMYYYTKSKNKQKEEKKKIEKKTKKIEKSVKGGFLYQIVKHYETIIILKVRLCFKTRSIPRTA